MLWHSLRRLYLLFILKLTFFIGHLWGISEKSNTYRMSLFLLSIIAQNEILPLIIVPLHTFRTFWKAWYVIWKKKQLALEYLGKFNEGKQFFIWTVTCETRVTIDRYVLNNRGKRSECFPLVS